ncbi:MAG: MFS transporter [Halobacteriota archaeon]
MAEHARGFKGRGVRVLLILSLTGFMVSFSESMLIPALPVLQSEFQTTEAVISWVPAIYLLVGSLTTPSFGKLGDTHGKKKLLLTALVFYTIAVIGNGFAWSIESLLAFRAIQGVGLAMFPLAFALIRDEFPKDKVATATGLVSAMFAVGATIGLVGGGWITQTFSWQTNYHLLAPVAAIVTLLVAWWVPESPLRTPSRLDAWGIVLLGIAIVGFLVPLTQGDVWGWGSPYTLGLFAIGVVATIALVYAELHVREPLIDFALKGVRYVLETNFIMFVAGFAMFLVYLALVYLTRTPPPVGFGLDTFQAALSFVPAGLVILVAGPLFGRIVNRRGAKNALLLASIVIVVSFVFLTVFNASLVEIVVGTMILFAGIGGIFVAAINVLILYVPPSKTGSETALNTIFRFIGGAVGTAVAGELLTLYQAPITVAVPGGTAVVLAPTSQAFAYIMAVALVLSIIGVITAFALKRAPVIDLSEGSEAHPNP